MKEIDWHHAPLHRFVPGAVHMVTAGTLQKQHLFSGDERLTLMRDLLLARLEETGWQPHAWACFSNHYHFLASGPSEGGDLGLLIKGLHSKLAIALNKKDRTPKRKVMYQFWDRCISYDESYYARLHYVMHNPVKHGLVENSLDYPYCSAHWFGANNSSAFRRRVESYKSDRVHEPDEF